MNKTYNYTSVKEVLSRLLRHPLLQDVTIEAVVQYVVDFIGIFGMPKLYQDKQVEVEIENFMGVLPCDLVSIKQVKDKKSNLCLTAMTDSFNPKQDMPTELSFKTQGRVIVTSFKEGTVEIVYNAIPVDEDGFPLVIDNPVFLKALELYVKKQMFTILFDMNKISPAVLQNVQQEYAWVAGQLHSEFTMPTLSELESIKNAWCTLLQRNNDFLMGFKNSGRQERLSILP